MIFCSVCNTENDQYATICVGCGGFLQNRIPNLDLFDTSWKIIENPKKAFRLITLSEHKNYAFFLYGLTGISIAFAEFWFLRIGNQFENILFLIFWALAIGILLGIGLCPIVSIFHWTLSKMFGGLATIRNSMGITSYALIPIVISLIVIMPIELLTFGMYLFTFNPNPMSLKPASYIVLLCFDMILVLWSWTLLIIGTKIGNQISLWKSVLMVSILMVLIVYGLSMGGKLLASFL